MVSLFQWSIIFIVLAFALGILFYELGLAIQPIQIILLLILIGIGIGSVFIMKFHWKRTEESSMEKAIDFLTKWIQKNFEGEKVHKDILAPEARYFGGELFYGFYTKTNKSEIIAIVKANPMDVVKFKRLPGAGIPTSPWSKFSPFLYGSPVAEPKPEPIPGRYFPEKAPLVEVKTGEIRPKPEEEEFKKLEKKR